MRSQVMLAGMMLVALALPASGQVLGTGVLPVTEVGPTSVNATITAIESTITAVEAVVQSAYMLLDLTPLDDIAIAVDYAETLGTLSALVKEGTGLMGDAQQARRQITALFNLEDVPHTPIALQQRIAETNLVIYEARQYAIRVQTLIASINSAIGHLVRIVELLGALQGTTQTNQATVQMLGVANQTMAIQTTQAAAHQRVVALEGLQRAMVAQSWNIIHCEQWSDWPGFQGCD